MKNYKTKRYKHIKMLGAIVTVALNTFILGNINKINFDEYSHVKASVRRPRSNVKVSVRHPQSKIDGYYEDDLFIEDLLYRPCHKKRNKSVVYIDKKKNDDEIFNCGSIKRKTKSCGIFRPRDEEQETINLFRRLYSTIGFLIGFNKYRDRDVNIILDEKGFEKFKKKYDKYDNLSLMYGLKEKDFPLSNKFTLLKNYVLIRCLKRDAGLNDLYLTKCKQLDDLRTELKETENRLEETQQELEELKKKNKGMTVNLEESKALEDTKKELEELKKKNERLTGLTVKLEQSIEKIQKSLKDSKNGIYNQDIENGLKEMNELIKKPDQVNPISTKLLWDNVNRYYEDIDETKRTIEDLQKMLKESREKLKKSQEKERKFERKIKYLLEQFKNNKKVQEGQTVENFTILRAEKPMAEKQLEAEKQLKKELLELQKENTMLIKANELKGQWIKRLRSAKDPIVAEQLRKEDLNLKELQKENTTLKKANETMEKQFKTLVEANKNIKEHYERLQHEEDKIRESQNNFHNYGGPIKINWYNNPFKKINVIKEEPDEGSLNNIHKSDKENEDAKIYKKMDFYMHDIIGTIKEKYEYESDFKTLKENNIRLMTEKEALEKDKKELMEKIINLETQKENQKKLMMEDEEVIEVLDNLSPDEATNIYLQHLRRKGRHLLRSNNEKDEKIKQMEENHNKQIEEIQKTATQEIEELLLTNREKYEKIKQMEETIKTKEEVIKNLETMNEHIIEEYGKTVNSYNFMHNNSSIKKEVEELRNRQSELNKKAEAMGKNNDEINTLSKVLENDIELIETKLKPYQNNMLIGMFKENQAKKLKKAKEKTKNKAKKKTKNIDNLYNAVIDDIKSMSNNLIKTTQKPETNKDNKLKNQNNLEIVDLNSKNELKPESNKNKIGILKEIKVEKLKKAEKKTKNIDNLYNAVIDDIKSMSNNLIKTTQKPETN